MRAVVVPTAARQHQERKTMTAAQTESLNTEGVRSLEVRWIVRGGLAAAVAGWFSRFPAEASVLEDAYLLDPHLPGLSVKVRGGRAGPSDRGLGEGQGCAVELTEVDAGGGAWWTLAFEATGPPDGLHSELEAAAALVFAGALPAGVELGMNYSRSYAQWLRLAAGGPGD